mmetsp:Transcript_42263/g.135284  ORF Transcript_42263/g.135284 Transcript_42263/m.135284 type:complete len:302 (+) Transcript_42263:424-1329(+)
MVQPVQRIVHHTVLAQHPAVVPQTQAPQELVAFCPPRCVRLLLAFFYARLSLHAPPADEHLELERGRGNGKEALLVLVRDLHVLAGHEVRGQLRDVFHHGDNRAHIVVVGFGVLLVDLAEGFGVVEHGAPEYVTHDELAQLLALLGELGKDLEEVVLVQHEDDAVGEGDGAVVAVDVVHPEHHLLPEGSPRYRDRPQRVGPIHPTHRHHPLVDDEHLFGLLGFVADVLVDGEGLRLEIYAQPLDECRRAPLEALDLLDPAAVQEEGHLGPQGAAHDLEVRVPVVRGVVVAMEAEVVAQTHP